MPAKAAPAKAVPAKAAPVKAAKAPAGAASVTAAKAPPAKAPAATGPVAKAPAKAVKASVKAAGPTPAAPAAPAEPSAAEAPPMAETVPASAPVKAPAPARTSPAKAAAVTKKETGPLTGDDAWTKKELADIRKELDKQAKELRGEIDEAEEQSAALQREAGGEGTGDEADAGTKTFEREHEMSLANNIRDLLLQVERAMARLDDGTYGRCENCSNPIPKARLQAAPRATLCVSCKQREERR